jgi:hypothetical protein
VSEAESLLKGQLGHMVKGEKIKAVFFCLAITLPLNEKVLK